MFKKISALIKEGKSNDNDVKNVGDETPAEEMEVKGAMMDEAKDQKDDEGGEMWKSPAFESPEVGYNEEKNLSVAKAMKSDSYDEWQAKDDPWTYSAKFGEGDRIEDVVFYATSPKTGKRVKVTQESNAEAFNAIAATNPEIMKMMEEGDADEADMMAEEAGPQGPAPGNIPERTEPAEGPAPGDTPERTEPAERGPAIPAMSQLAEAVEGKTPEEVQAWVVENSDQAAAYLAQITAAMGKLSAEVTGVGQNNPNNFAGKSTKPGDIWSYKPVTGKGE
tara:strand:- start:13135 stop:13968 length:834 start_codon:yes stop_codon:yes gene_type:complete